MSVTGYQGDPNLLTLGQAAALLGIAESTARRQAQQGTFPGGAAIKVGKAWRVSLPRLNRYLHGVPLPSQVCGVTQLTAQ